MSPVFVLALEHHRPQRPPLQSRRHLQVLWEIRKPKLDMRVILFQIINAAVFCVPVLVVDPDTGRWTCGGELVDGHPG